ncbi:hypothetical protein TNCV_3635781 [Trichonephila clavipes]|nr:hypothetical protein TNCV_3635781 [Trichonephila clavipes]
MTKSWRIAVIEYYNFLPISLRIFAQRGIRDHYLLCNGEQKRKGANERVKPKIDGGCEMWNTEYSLLSGDEAEAYWMAINGPPFKHVLH